MTITKHIKTHLPITKFSNQKTLIQPTTVFKNRMFVATNLAIQNISLQKGLNTMTPPFFPDVPLQPSNHNLSIIPLLLLQNP